MTNQPARHDGASPEPARRPLPRWRRLMFALLPTVLLLLVAEGGARWWCWQRFAPFDTNVRIQGDARWQDDDALIWRNRPFYLEYDQSAQYDEHGLRVVPGATRLPPKAANELRVLLLGGSAMAGVGSSQRGDWLAITGISTHPIAASIDGQLEAQLHAALPGTTVRVLNAAVASHTIAQSHRNYQALRGLDPDWVVSMDGVNEPSSLAAGETVWRRLEARWRRHPVNRFPFQPARVVMRNSALAFLLGEYVFFRTGIIRTARDAGRDPATLDRWRSHDAGALTMPPPTADQERAVDAYLAGVESFRRDLVDDDQRHVLLVQPHLSLRDPSRLTDTEQALYRYYHHLHHGQADPFMAALHARVAQAYADTSSVASLDALHHADNGVFLDYCHLTVAANEQVATRLAQVILADRQSSETTGETTIPP